MLHYAISPGALQRVDGVDADRLVRRAVELSGRGVDYLLLREKQLSAADLTELSRRVVQETAGSPTRILVPQSAGIALAAGAHGVHLSASRAQERVSEVRQMLPAAWISVSCHVLEEVERARKEGADAVLFAPVFGKTVEGVQVAPGVGLERLEEACAAAAPMAVFALGGVCPGNVARCRAVGASGVAAIRMFFK